jgi:hypothetical protein
MLWRMAPQCWLFWSRHSGPFPGHIATDNRLGSIPLSSESLRSFKHIDCARKEVEWQSVGMQVDGHIAIITLILPAIVFVDRPAGYAARHKLSHRQSTRIWLKGSQLQGTINIVPPEARSLTYT